MMVVTSAINSDHKAITALSAGEVRGYHKTFRTTPFRRRSPNLHTALLRQLPSFDLSETYAIERVQEAWIEFYENVTERLNRV